MAKNKSNFNSENTSKEAYLKLLQLKSGPMEYRFTNDYLFRASLQSNEEACKELICALLDIPPEDVKSLQILNPIELGDALDEKTCILDVKLLLNDKTILNIELQIQNEGDWPERSLTYLCRAFDQLTKGMEYRDVKSTLHIGILGFTPIPDNPAFYSEYLLSDTKTHKKYSDRFSLRVLDLSQIEQATKEQKQSKLYYWARLFLATTWEEIRMLTDKNDTIQETVFTLLELSEDDKIRMQCEARERYDRDMASYKTYCETIGMEKGMERGMEKGMEKGMERGMEEIIEKLLIKGKSIQEIVELLDIKEEKVRKVKDGIAVKK